MLTLITHISIAMGVDGHRADIVMHKTACTIAAWEDRAPGKPHPERSSVAMTPSPVSYTHLTLPTILLV